MIMKKEINTNGKLERLANGLHFFVEQAESNDDGSISSAVLIDSETEERFEIGYSKVEEPKTKWKQTKEKFDEIDELRRRTDSLLEVMNNSFTNKLFYLENGRITD